MSLKSFIRKNIKKPKICLVFCTYNEEKHLPQFLEYLEPYVDFIVALDDGSTDNTVKILESSPKLKYLIKHKKKNTRDDIDEGTNRAIVSKAARENGADWALAIDPDERPELRFLQNIRSIVAEAPDEVCYGLHFRECWGDAHKYRSDGIWGRKRRHGFYTLQDDDEFKYKQRIHSKWYADQLVGKEQDLDYSIYHLKMVKKSERKARQDLYNRIDSKKEYQPIGYDYLTDENGLMLTSIPNDEAYDYNSVPKDILDYKEA